MNLPDITGEQVLATLKHDARTERIPVIILTAEVSVDQGPRLLELGASSFHTHPLDAPASSPRLTRLSQPSLPCPSQNQLDTLDPTQSALRGMRIVVVDDEQANTALLTGLLKRWHFTSVVAITDPTTVVDAFEELVPDLLMLDINMPVLNGFDVMRLLDHWTHGSTPVPVLVLTADVTDETEHQALSLGARDFLTKPFDPEEVRLRVSNLLEMRLLQLQLKTHGDDLEARVHKRTHQLSRSPRAHPSSRPDRRVPRRRTHQHAQRIGHTAALLAAGLGLAPGTVDASASRLPCTTSARSQSPTPSSSKRAAHRRGVRDHQSHTLIGARILGGSQSQLLRTAAEIALSHHERWDDRLPRRPR